MHLSDEQLNQVKELARHFFTPREIAIFLQMDIEDFLDAVANEKNPVFLHYQGGVLQTKYEVNKQVLQLASSGSSPAQLMVLGMMKETKMKEVDR